MPPRKIPQASRINVFRAIHQILGVGELERVTPEVLQRAGVGQVKQTMALISFLKLLDDNGRLRSDLLDARTQASLFQRRLAECGRRALVDQARCADDEVRILGDHAVGVADFREQAALWRGLNSYPRDSRPTYIRCLAALHEITTRPDPEHPSDESPTWFGWIEASAGEPSRSAAVRIDPGEPAARSGRERESAGDGSTAAAGPPTALPEDAPEPSASGDILDQVFNMFENGQLRLTKAAGSDEPVVPLRVVDGKSIVSRTPGTLSRGTTYIQVTLEFDAEQVAEFPAPPGISHRVTHERNAP